MIQVRLLFTQPNAVWLIPIKLDIWRLAIYISSGDTIVSSPTPKTSVGQTVIPDCSAARDYSHTPHVSENQVQPLGLYCLGCQSSSPQEARPQGKDQELQLNFLILNEY